MDYDPKTIFLVILGLFLVLYFIMTGYTYLFFKFSKVPMPFSKKRLFLLLPLVSLAALLLMFLAVMFAITIGIFLFLSFLAFVIIFGVGYFLSAKHFGFGTRHKYIYSLVLAAILNPVWLVVTGLV